MSQTDKTDNVSTAQNLPLDFASSGKVKDILVKVGDRVTMGEVLATITPDNMDGALTQAEAAYEIAEANYQKIISGATGATIDVAKAAVNTAKVNLDEITKQQEVLVDNAFRALLNSSLQTQSVYSGAYTSAYDSPTVSGTYECNQEGSYNLEIYSSSGGYSVSYSGLETGMSLLTDVPRPLGTCGLFLSFDKTKTPTSGAQFSIQIPNNSAPNYSLNNNTYQLALQNKDQAIAGAQAALDQANATLESVVTSARPEDVAIAKAQVENAQGALALNAAYRNTIITAPGDGTITAVYIINGQTIASNTPAIGFLESSN